MDSHDSWAAQTNKAAISPLICLEKNNKRPQNAKKTEVQWNQQIIWIITETQQLGTTNTQKEVTNICELSQETFFSAQHLRWVYEHIQWHDRPSLEALR